MKRSHRRLVGRETKRKQVEEELAGKLRLHALLGELSSRFVALKAEQVDPVIVEAQRLIVETLGIDRSGLWQRAGESGNLILTLQWERPGWSAIPAGFEARENLPWSYECIMNGDLVCFARVADLPPEAARDAVAFRKHGIRSNVTVPLLANRNVFGGLSFSTRGEERHWSAEEIAELKLVAQVVANVVGRQRAELREEELREELAHAMRVASLGELAATLTHELNQPLAAILSNAQAARRFMAEGSFDADELRTILDDIVRDNKRAGAVIHNLRTMVSKLPKPRERCSLNQLVLEVFDLLRSEFIEARIEGRLTLAPALPVIEAVRVEIQQMIVNLLINAIHAMHDTPNHQRFIDIETRLTREDIELTVRDRGHGIPPERLATIFNPFVSSRTDGLGMGLSITRRIVESHGGRITGCNCEDGGALFTATLPLESFTK